MKYVEGGVCAAKGFKASGVHCGIRKNKNKKDLALIFSETKCSAACVYTTNKVKGAPIYVTKENLTDGFARAVICNSGNANTCNANGAEIAKGMCALAAQYLNISEKDVIVASTGVIGQPFSLEPIKAGMKDLVDNLGDCSEAANEAIMTTDVIRKSAAVSFELDGKECFIGGIAKGSGMIHPNMATMLVFVTTDVSITAGMLQKAVSQDVNESFNMVSIDADTSTNDMLSVMANGLAGNTLIENDCEDFEIFKKALAMVTQKLCKLIAKDGEGATKLLESHVSGAKDKECAKIVAKSIITSNLFKAAMFGADANWGRALCAIGYSGADVDVNKVDLTFESSAGAIEVCKNGSGLNFDENKAKKILSENEIKILIELNSGEEKAVAWGCDLTYDYVKINGDYRT